MPTLHPFRPVTRHLLGLLCTLALGCLVAGKSSAAVAIGVVENPCVDVPIQPTAAHKASADWYDSWMKEWLALDWGQRCRYQAENAQLPAPSAARIVFMGDSITEGWKPAVPSFFTGDRLDRGIGGQTTEQMIVRFRPDVINLHPAVVHIMGGTNDVAGNRGPTTIAQIESNIQSMVEQARHAKIAVVIASIPPAASFTWSPIKQVPQTIQTINQWLKAYAAREHLVYVDYYSALANAQGGLRADYSEDGVHPNAAGYAAMQPLTEHALAKALKQASKR
jgi:lysophospholipase L1-like esterase